MKLSVYFEHSDCSVTFAFFQLISPLQAAGPWIPTRHITDCRIPFLIANAIQSLSVVFSFYL